MSQHQFLLDLLPSTKGNWMVLEGQLGGNNIFSLANCQALPNLCCEIISGWGPTNQKSDSEELLKFK